MAILGRYPKFRVVDRNGAPLASGKVYTYVTGTETPKATYTTAAATTPNDNPTVLDARGEASIYFDGDYKVIVKNSDGAVVWSRDNINPQSASDNPDFLDTNGNYIVDFTYVSSAVNYVEIKSADSGSNPEITVGGDDANINLTLASKGSGTITFDDNVTFEDIYFQTGIAPTSGSLNLAFASSGDSSKQIKFEPDSGVFNITVTNNGALNITSTVDFQGASNSFNKALAVAGGLIVNPDAAVGSLTFREGSDNGANYITLQTLAALSANRAIGLPVSAPTNGYGIQTDGDGNWSWATYSASFPQAEESTPGIAEFATVAEVSGATSAKAVTPSTAKYLPLACKVYLQYDQTGPTIVSSRNVTSVTDNGTEDFTINFTTDFADVNYCVFINRFLDNSGTAAVNRNTRITKAVGSLNVVNPSASADHEYNFVVLYGNF